MNNLLLIMVFVVYFVLVHLQRPIKLKKLIPINATKDLLFFCFLAPLGMIIHCEYVRKTFDKFPEEAQYLWTQGFFKHSRHIFFHWMLLHNTDQTQQHSCGRGCIQHIQLHLGWASKARCLSTAKPAHDTFEVCRYPVADEFTLASMRVHVCVAFVLLC